jgi:hypothetical protein
LPEPARRPYRAQSDWQPRFDAKDRERPQGPIRKQFRSGGSRAWYIAWPCLPRLLNRSVKNGRHICPCWFVVEPNRHERHRLHDAQAMIQAPAEKRCISGRNQDPWASKPVGIGHEPRGTGGWRTRRRSETRHSHGWQNVMAGSLPYATTVAFFGHAVGETSADLQAIIANSRDGKTSSRGSVRAARRSESLAENGGLGNRPEGPHSNPEFWQRVYSATPGTDECPSASSHGLLVVAPIVAAAVPAGKVTWVTSGSGLRVVHIMCYQ